jgi:glycosyltransferase involved in cell wall biosynthesis
MRILICSREAPLPPSNGHRLQVVALREQLAKRHELRVLAFRMPDQRADATDARDMRLLESPPPRGTIGKIGSNVRSLVAWRPRGFDELIEALREPLMEELERFQPEVVHATMGHLAAFTDQLAGRATVVAPLDAWHLNYAAEAEVATHARRLLLRSDVARMRRFEGTQYRRFGRVVVVSDDNAHALRKLDPALEVTVIPNGVDCERFSPRPSATRDPNLVLFTGVMSYAPNVTAATFLARRVMPLVRAVRPDARLAIVGRAPADRVRALADLDGVDVVGEVPDMTAWLTRGRAYACPMLTGHGIKNKLLEALASGLPSVATPRALTGLTVTPGRHVLVGNDEEELAAHLVHMLANDGAAEALARAGREYATANHSWEAVGRAYERVYAEVLATVGTRAGSRSSSRLKATEASAGDEGQITLPS